MRKSVFYSLKTFTQGRVPSADASTGSISYKVDVWHFLVLPSETHAVANMTSLRAIDGDTSYH